MRYIVDGYNLLFALESVLDPFEKTREDFIVLLNMLSERSGLKITLVFDTHKNPIGSELPSAKTYKSIEIIYAPGDLSCDDYILEMLAGLKVTPQWTLVTSDKHLIQQASRKKVLCITVDQFISLINNKITKKQQSLDKNIPSAKRSEYARWQKIFEKKIRKDDY